MECDYGVKDEYFAIESRRGWQPLFMEIREKSANYSTSESKKVNNRFLNRYRDVNPFDHSRIVLTRGNCCYINASLVKMPAVNRNYILTQGPLSSTVSHFWAMVWEQNSKVIVMLNNIIEKNQVKCHTYWPSGSINSVLECEDVQLKVELIDEIQKPNYILRNFKLSSTTSDEERVVHQYHYITWPDFGVPVAPSDFLQYLQDVRQTGGLGSGSEDEQIGPAVIHCSAGIGRSGTFCIVDTALLLLEQGKRVNVKELVLEMRRYRMGLVQTAEQLRFSYLSIIEGAQCMNLDLRAGQSFSSNGAELTNSSEDDDSDSLSDESNNPEEVEEEIDVISNGIRNHCQPTIVDNVPLDNKCANEEDEPPPPIPPRSESLVSPNSGSDNNYDRPLPQVPPRPKRPHEHMEAVSTESESEIEDVAEIQLTDEISGSEMERKRRKQTEETPPRTAESENGTDLRQRRLDRIEKTQQMITAMKEKQKEMDKKADNAKLLQTGSKWLGMGVGIFVLVCVGFRYFQG